MHVARHFDGGHNGLHKNEWGMRGNQTIGDQAKTMCNVRKNGAFQNELFFERETPDQSTRQIKHEKNRHP